MKSSGKFTRYFVVGYTVFFLILYLPRFIGITTSSGAFTKLQFVWQDFLFQHDTNLKPGDPRLILIAADDETVKKYGFPLPRKEYAPALDKLKAYGVSTVIFDVMFFEPREGDPELIAATKRFGKVVHLFAQEIKVTSHGEVVNTSMPIPPLLKATKHIGHPNIEELLDDDGHMRKYELFRTGTPDPIRPGFDAVSLEAATLAAYQDKTVEQIRTEHGTDVHMLNFRKPRDWYRHEFRDHASKAENVDMIPSPYRRISLLDILSGELTADQKKALKGSICVVGSTTLGYYDHYPTPFIESAPGAEFHLNAVDNELNGDPMTSWSRLPTLLLIIGAILFTWWLQRFPPAIGAGLALGSLLAWLGYSLHMFHTGTIIEFPPPAAALVSSYLVLVGHRAMTEGEEKKAIKGVFGQFVAPDVVEELAKDPSKLKLGGEKRDLTIFFLDIAHFTNISEQMDPEALIQFLNKYLTGLSHEILERRGTIDKYIGDCIMAFWNAPKANPDHRLDAILSALRCQEVIKDLNKTLDKKMPEIPAVRIGLNSGIATVGLTGSERKKQYTVIGDEVNLASRLEGANKFFGSKIMMSEGTYKGTESRIEARTLGRVRVIGKLVPIKVFEPLAEKGKLSAEWRKGLPLYEAGVAAYDGKKYSEALGNFEKFAEIFPKDGPGQLYLRLCKDYSVIAPDENWDGVFKLTEK